MVVDNLEREMPSLVREPIINAIHPETDTSLRTAECRSSVDLCRTETEQDPCSGLRRERALWDGEKTLPASTWSTIMDFFESQEATWRPSVVEGIGYIER